MVVDSFPFPHFQQQLSILKLTKIIEKKTEIDIMTLRSKAKGGGTPQPIHANLSTEFVNMTHMSQNSKTPLHGNQVNFFLRGIVRQGFGRCTWQTKFTSVN